MALYGVDRLIARKKEEKNALDAEWSTDDIIRDREELAEQIRALGELKEMAAKYGFDISGPARTAKEAVQWLYFGYLAGVKEQNGAAMSLGRTSTFLDIYFERDLAAGLLTEEQAQEIVDDFVIKLRIVRFLRTPEYDELFSGDPTWVTESIGGMGDDGRPLVTKQQLPLPADALQSRAGAGAQSDDLVHAAACRSISAASPPRSRSTPARSSSRATRSCAAPGATTARSPAASRRCASASRCSSSAPAPTSPNACSMRSTAAGTRSPASRSRPPSGPCEGDILEFDDVLEKFEHMMDWLAGVYVSAMNVIHYMHDKYAYERIEMALHDYAPFRTMAFGIAGMSVVADSLSAIKYAKVKVVRDETGLVVDYVTEGEFPVFGNNDNRVDHLATWLVSTFMEQAAQVPDLPQRAAHPVGADHHLERGLRQGDRQHAGRPPARRALRARRQSDARPRQPRHPRLGRLGRQDSLSRRRRRHFADHDHRSDRTWPHAGGTRAPT